MSLLVEKVCDVCQEEFSSPAAMKCHIVKPELKDVPDDTKFCGCHKIAQLAHNWEIKKSRNPIDGEGWMDPHIGTKDEAIMITKVCKVCRNVLLIRVDSDACSSCRG